MHFLYCSGHISRTWQLPEVMGSCIGDAVSNIYALFCKVLLESSSYTRGHMGRRKKPRYDGCEAGMGIDASMVHWRPLEKFRKELSYEKWAYEETLGPNKLIVLGYFFLIHEYLFYRCQWGDEWVNKQNCLWKKKKEVKDCLWINEEYPGMCEWRTLIKPNNSVHFEKSHRLSLRDINLI